MSSNQKNSGIKSTLEFGPVIIFFLAYILFDRYDISLNIYGQTYEGFVLATTIFIPIIFTSYSLSFISTFNYVEPFIIGSERIYLYRYVFPTSTTVNSII